MKDSGELITDLKNKDSSVRRHAIEMLGIMGDKNRFVRQEAITSLGKIGGERVVGPLTQALGEEKDEFVQDSIRKDLERLRK